MIWSWTIRILQCIFDILQLYSTHVRWLTKSITINSKSVSINCFISVFFKWIKDKIVNDCIGPRGNHFIRSWVSLQAWTERETDQNPEMSRGVRSHAGMVGYNCPRHSFITASIDGFTLESSCLLCFWERHHWHLNSIELSPWEPVFLTCNLVLQLLGEL